MSAENSELRRRPESIKAGALRFVDEMGESTTVGSGASVRGASGVWSGENENDRARSNVIGHRLRLFTVDLAVAVAQKRSIV